VTTADYRKGFTDGLAQGPKVDAALKAADGTAYLCVGGPKDGQYVKTLGVAEFYVPEPMSLDYPLWSMSDARRYLDTSLGTGTYIRKDVVDSQGRRRTLYAWLGWR
jgi:hypothetical protein